jgi:hypothetical protein
VRAHLAFEEHDEQPGGSTETGFIDWIDYRKASERPIFPPIGPCRVPKVPDVR